MRVVRILVLVVLLPLAATACEQRVEIAAERDPATEPQPETAPSPGDPDPEEPAEPFDGTTGVTERDAGDASQATLDDLRTSQREGFERVVFEFREGRRPGHRIAYAQPPFTECGSGHEVEVQGDAFIEVNLAPAAAHATRTDERERTIGERERRPDYTNLIHMRETCDHHGGVTWILGLRGQQEYRVLELDEPARLVLDIRSPR